MMKSINITTRITILILMVSLVAVASISFFSYDYHQKVNEEKSAATLASLVDNRAAYLNTFLDKAALAVRVLQSSDRLKSGGGASTAPADDPMAAMMAMMPPSPEPDAASDTTSDMTEEPADSGNSLVDYLNDQKLLLDVAQITITSDKGAVVASTDPTVKGNFIDTDGHIFEKAKSEIYFTEVSRDNRKKNFYSYVAGAVTDASGAQQIIIVTIDLTHPYRVLKNYHGLGATGELLLGRVSPNRARLPSSARNATTPRRPLFRTTRPITS
jgi:hypothetical protein